MARNVKRRTTRTDSRLDSPKGLRTNFRPFGGRRDRVGRFSESFARAMGTPWFLVGMTVFVIVWIAYNTWAPETAQFDPRALNFTLLTLILSLQASYAAPLILLAQNRQDDRDRVHHRAGPPARRAQPQRHRVPRARGGRAAARGEGSRIEGLHPRRAARPARGAREGEGRQE